ncbi:tRNA (guanosine(37)-N1)-methyltransferase TrmD [Alphaproteobacteria bacterium]|nr:tRNA (guanosine(37)-N1)-methyltransferase TrmD [Alphaproteobacteria bacterium]
MNNKIEIHVLTLFPEIFPGPLGVSVTGKALKNGIWGLKTINIRDFANDQRGSVDDSPFGGGPGMVIRPDILDKAIEFSNSKFNNKLNPKTVYLSPRGKKFDQEYAKKLLSHESLTIICGRYEGIDERIINSRNIEEISLGDFITTGGENTAFVFIDVIVRLLPGVLGSSESLIEESFTNNLLEYPQYTRPKLWNKEEVPGVLLSGNHAKIKSWRKERSEFDTRNRRPDLWQRYLIDNK